MKAIDWIGRTLLLILAGLATLSIFASLDTVSHLPPGFAVEVAMDAPAGDRAAEGRGPRFEGLMPEGQIAIPQAGSPRDSAAAERIAGWLQALTYAVLALAGFVAAGFVVLLRISASLARIAARD